MKYYLCMIAIAFAGSGCTTAPHPNSLNEELGSANTAEERTAILRFECIQEAKALPVMVPKHSPDYDPQVRRFIYLCDAMAEPMLKEDDKTRTTLALKCRNEIKSGISLTNDRTLPHYKNLKEICEKMTGEPVDIGLSLPLPPKSNASPITDLK